MAVRQNLHLPPFAGVRKSSTGPFTPLDFFGALLRAQSAPGFGLNMTGDLDCQTSCWCQKLRIVKRSNRDRNGDVVAFLASWSEYGDSPNQPPNFYRFLPIYGHARIVHRWFGTLFFSLPLTTNQQQPTNQQKNKPTKVFTWTASSPDRKRD